MTWPLAPRSTFSTGKPGRYDVAPVDPSKRRRGRSRKRDQPHPGVFLPRQRSHQGKSKLIVCLPGVTSRLRGVVAILL